MASPEHEADGSEQVHPWSAFYDDEGRIYYYNNDTGESSWDAPEQFNPPPPQDDEQGGDDDANATAQEGQQEGRQETDVGEGEGEGGVAGSAESAWVAYQDDEGREYYYNTVTEETTWDKPPDFQPEQADEDVSAQPTSPIRSPSPVAPPEYGGESPMPQEEEKADDEGEKEPKQAEEKEPEEEVEEPEKEPEEEIDPEVLRFQQAENALNQPDAILEPGVMSHVTEVVTKSGGNPLKAIQALSDSYYGQTAVCGLLGKWLADLKAQSATPDESEQAKLFKKAGDSIRGMVQDVINKIAKERFTKTGGDSILNLSRSEAAFLEDMMDSNRWRKLLIDLSASNKDSALLMYCLQAISKRGHHREIARRIDQSGHFAVFNAMIASELAVIGKIAVSACRDKDTSISLSELVGDLQRTCTATAYTYIYAIEVLRHLVATAKEMSASTAATTSSSRFYRAIRKWERLSEQLQSNMVDPSSASGSTPLFRKRRLDVAVTISELHQRQRRRLRPSLDGPTDGGYHQAKSNDHRAKVETAVVQFLRRYSLGTQMDDRILDTMLSSGVDGESGNLVGKMLIKRPLAVKALLGYIYKPGIQRISSLVTRNKCARLIAIAVLAAEKEALLECKEANHNVSSDSDEATLTRMISEGSQLCERLEDMVSFIVTTDTDVDPKNALLFSPGEQLCVLASKCAAVAQGVAIWARGMSTGNDFVQSASYAPLSPSLLSLIRILYLKHPLLGDDALDVALRFIEHNNSEISYQKMNEIKEQALRLLLFLIAKGEGPAVLRHMARLLKHAGNSCLDSSLIRYFMSGMLEIVSPPFSIPFVRAICELLRTQGITEAILASYFDAASKSRLKNLLTYFKGLLSEQGKLRLMQEDRNLVAAVFSTYSKSY